MWLSDKKLLEKKSEFFLIDCVTLKMKTTVRRGHSREVTVIPSIL